MTVDGTDFFAVYEAAGEVIRRARRWRAVAARMQDDPLLRPFRRRCADLRAPGELDDIRSNKDCEQGLPEEVRERRDAGRRHLTGRTRGDRQEVAALIDRAVVEAKEAPLPTAADLLTDVYVKY